MCTVLLPKGVNQIPVNKYITLYIVYISKALKGESVTFSALKCVRRCIVSCSNKAAIYCWIIFPRE